MEDHLYYQYQVYRHQLSKLQAHKSSFQAWKCVSFGYALLATVLLSAKWHEVSTDLKLLNGIDRLLWQTGPADNATAAVYGLPAPSSANRSVFSEDDGDPPLDTLGLPLSELNRWSPAAALELLSAANLSETAADGAEPPRNGSSAAIMMSHMQVALGRELNGNQLLKREVETFLGECKSVSGPESRAGGRGDSRTEVASKQS
jgi:hypothetical protein